MFTANHRLYFCSTFILDWPQKQDPGPHVLPNFNTTKYDLSYLFYIIAILWSLYFCTGIQSYFKFSLWFQECLKGRHRVPQKLCSLICFKELIPPQTTIMPLQLSIAPLLLMVRLKAVSSSTSQAFEAHKHHSYGPKQLYNCHF